MLTNNYVAEQNNLKDKVNWMEKSINLAILRYNELEKVLNIPSNKIHTEIKNSSAPFELTFISKKRRQEIVSSKYEFQKKLINL